MVVNSIKLFWYNETTAIMYNQLQVNFTWLIDKCYRNKKKFKIKNAKKLQNFCLMTIN